MILAVLSALGAMTLFGVAAVLQGLATAHAADGDLLDPRLLLTLARQRTFVAALVLNLLGFGLHVTALQDLPLFLVQSIIAGSVAVTALVSVRVLHAHLTVRSWAAVALVVLGLVLLAPTAAEGDAVAGGAAAAGVLLGVVLALAGLSAAVRRVPGTAGTVLLGLLSGAGFGVVAVCARLLPELGPALVTSPVTYVLALAGGNAYLVYSAAMQRGSVTTATAALVISQTVVPAVAGLFLGDTVRAGLVPLAVAGFALALAGAVVLGRSDSGPPVPVGAGSRLLDS